MNKPKEKDDMQTLSTQNIPLPLPVKQKKRIMQAEVNLDLFQAVSREIKRRNIKIRQVMEWGLEKFLVETNPKEAEKLGLLKKEK